MRSARQGLADASRPGSSIRGASGIASAGSQAECLRLIDARGAGRLLGVPHTWLLAQARAGRIPHHRLGHYVRFSPAELAEWLASDRAERVQSPRAKASVARPRS
jgi:excisionase family DNA binding protein